MFFLCLHNTDETDDALPPFEDDADIADDDEEDETDEDEEDEADEDEEDEADDALPTFEDEECPPAFGFDLCVKVVFPNGMEDMLLLARDSPNSTVYEGIVMGEEDVSVVLIDAPEDGERIVSRSTPFWGSLKRLYCLLNGNFRLTYIIFLCRSILTVIILFIATCLMLI